MQLIDSSLDSRPGGPGLRAGLAAAACALLGAAAGAGAETQVETATLVYSETDRVTAVETVVEGKRAFDNGQTLGVKIVYDALTGASANGAVPADRAQTFTRPSGKGAYSVKPGETPLDDTFHDTRVAGSTTWSVPLNRLTRANLGFNASSEYDYLSLGASGGISRDLALKNTTLSLGFSFSRDQIDPVGGIPEPLAPMAPAGREQPRIAGDDTKTVLDLLVGVTQVLGRASLARLNYSFSRSSGYLTDPFKMVSVVQGPMAGTPGDPLEHLFERRPGDRTKHSLFGEIRRMLGRDVASASYRLFWDDWGIRSHTVDLHYNRPLGSRSYVEPHLRYYSQGKADFYKRFLVDGQALPDFASADYRLGDFHATTAGLEAGRALGNGIQVRAGVEYYLQQGDSSPPEAFGALLDQDLFPDVKAWMIRLGGSMPLKW